VKVEKIKDAILALSNEERLELEFWFSDCWDQEMSRDFSQGGRGASLVDRVDADIQAGKFRPLSQR
jgi:hypothetical protein